jgi:site-specific DNA recombinase
MQRAAGRAAHSGMDRGPVTQALRALLGGKISVWEVRQPGRQRHYLRGRLELRLWAVAGAIGAKVSDPVLSEPAVTKVIEIDFRTPKRHELIADDVKRYWDDGMRDIDIVKLFDCSRALISSALDYWHKSRGLERPDGRSVKKRLRGSRKSAQLQLQVMDLWKQDWPVSAIAKKLNCGLEVVRDAVVAWHQGRGLPVPDGRARRREIRLRRRSAG